MPVHDEIRTFQCFPDGKFYTLEELQSLLNFQYAPHNTFESVEAQEELKHRGIAKFHNQGVSQEAQELGSRWIEKIRSAYIPAVSIRWLDENLGYGLFAEEVLEEGAYVGEYTGFVRENDRRYFEPLNNYCYEYPISDDSGKHHVIDATAGNLTRFINHSYTPNLKPLHVFYEGFYHLIFLAIQRIEKGSQLSYNYGKNYWYIRQEPFPL